jgi:hypothetical protein
VDAQAGSPGPVIFARGAHDTRRQRRRLGPDQEARMSLCISERARKDRKPFIGAKMAG